jgi:putative MATE family efflux protein
MNTTTVIKGSSSHHHSGVPETSITEGSIWKALLAFFFPILFGTVFQQLYNTVDAIVVGRFVGKEALAAVGGGSGVYVNLLVGFFVGLTSGAGVIISQFYGAKNLRDISRAVHTSMALSIAGGVVLTGLGIVFSKPMMVATKTPADILDESLLYLRIYFYGMVPLFVYNMGSSILRAVGDSKSPLYILIAGCITNIILDLLFVAVFKWGVAGAAWATIGSEAESAVIVLILLHRTHESYKFEWKKLSFTGHILREIIRIGFPAGIQSILYTISNLIIQASINSFGTDVVAAWAAYGKIDAVFWMMINAFGIAVTTFSGQNYGAHQYDRVKKGMWESLGMSCALTLFCCVLFWFFGKPVFMLFTTDETVITSGMEMLHFLVPYWITYISIEILSGTIRGAGSSFIPMMITVFGVCVLRIVWIFTAGIAWPKVTTILASYPITWTVTSLLFWIYYASGKWLKKQDKLTA